MIQSTRLRLGLFALLAAVMAGTRLNHFGVLPDASWAVFFIAGFYLHANVRWAFPALMLVAVAVDYVVISGAGMDFWAHYCVSPGYWFLLPAYFSMWIGGQLVQRWHRGPAPRALALLALSTIASVAACHLFAQGGFYWLSDVVAQPSFAGWFKNYGDWFLPYLRTTAVYVGIAATLHVGTLAVLRPAATGARDAAR